MDQDDQDALAIALVLTDGRDPNRWTLDLARRIVQGPVKQIVRRSIMDTAAMARRVA